MSHGHPLGRFTAPAGGETKGKSAEEAKDDASQSVSAAASQVQDSVASGAQYVKDRCVSPCKLAWHHTTSAMRIYSHVVSAATPRLYMLHFVDCQQDCTVLVHKSTSCLACCLHVGSLHMPLSDVCETYRELSTLFSFARLSYLVHWHAVPLSVCSTTVRVDMRYHSAWTLACSTAVGMQSYFAWTCSVSVQLAQASKVCPLLPDCRFTADPSGGSKGKETADEARAKAGKTKDQAGSFLSGLLPKSNEGDVGGSGESKTLSDKAQDQYDHLKNEASKTQDSIADQVH